MVVAPGFIDMLGQSEMDLSWSTRICPPRSSRNHHRDHRRGVNHRAAESTPSLKADHVTWEHYGVQPTWRTFRGYFARLRKQGNRD